MDGDREVGRLAVNALARGRVRVLGTHRLPAPFADGKALGALQTVAGVVRPTQGAAIRSSCPAGCPVAADPAAGCRCTSCRYAPLATLEHVLQILVVQRAYCNLNAAVERYAAVLGERPLALVSCLWTRR